MHLALELSRSVAHRTLGLGEVATMMRHHPGFSEALERLRIPSLQYFLRLFPEFDVQATPAGETARNRYGHAWT